MKRNRYEVRVSALQKVEATVVVYASDSSEAEDIANEEIANFKQEWLPKEDEDPDEWEVEEVQELPPEDEDDYDPDDDR
jgi:hypothetical protein